MSRKIKARQIRNKQYKTLIASIDKLIKEWKPMTNNEMQLYTKCYLALKDIQSEIK